MFAPMQICASPSLLGQAAAFVFDRSIRRPLLGLVEISEAVAVVMPRLVKAAATAVIQAISGQLSTAAKAQVHHGWQRLCDGMKLLIWPIGLFAALGLWQFPGGFCLMVLAALLIVLAVGGGATAAIGSAARAA